MNLRLLASILLTALAVRAQSSADQTWSWNLPKGFPKPPVPADNPMTPAKVELGRHLFYDVRLSVNGRSSCGTCHKQELAFTDGRATGLGATGESHSRGPMSLVNIAYSKQLTWNNPEAKTLEQQALVPMLGEHPIELGLKGDWLKPLRAEKTYQELFTRAFGDKPDPFTIDNVTRALASFERSIISGRSPYDRYHYDRDDNAVSEAAKRGEIVFFSQQVSCFQCHGGFNFSSNGFHNTGLYNTPGGSSYPEPNVGIAEFTLDPGDVGKFKVPTLRNIAVTAPYMHDGSIKTLDEVVDHYAAGGRTVSSGPFAGVGHENPNKDPRIHGFALTSQQRADLVEFLKSLTDNEVLHDPRFSDPFLK